MDIFIGFIFLITWITIIVTDFILRSCMCFGYLYILDLTGFSIKPFQLKWFCSRFNSFIVMVSNRFPRFFRKWFNIGTAVSLLFIPISIFILSKTVIDLVKSLITNSTGHQLLQPVLPGVNLPFTDFGYYFLSLIISSSFHELGHAIAAGREGIRVYGMGVFILGIIPCCYVEISTEQLLSANARRQLRIMCAGVWHNIILATISALLLLANPIFLSPFYYMNEGAVIINVDRSSGASGPNGLKEGDLITSININCLIFGKDSWGKCLLDVDSTSSHGYCASSEYLEKEQLHSLDPQNCCGEKSNRNLCFQDMKNLQKICLPVRSLIENFNAICYNQTDCGDANCVIAFPENNTLTKLIQLKRSNKEDFLFWGTPYELYKAITVIDYRPKIPWLPSISIYRYELLLKYITSFSMALAVLNAIPCPFLDGSWIINSFMDLFPPNFFLFQCKKTIKRIFIVAGSTLLITCLFLGLYQLFR